MKLLEGKKAAIFGVANDRSIAWAISEAFHAEGGELAFTYAGERLEERVRPGGRPRGAAHGRAKRFDIDANVHGLGKSHSQLQRHGRCQGGVGSERALHGARSWPEGHSCKRDLRWAN